MSQDIDDTVAQRAASDDADRDEALALAREEARATFEYQVQRLREIDNKAVEILKANLFLIGVFVTGISIVVQTGQSVAPFVNAFTLAGGVVLLASTAVAGVTYTASNLRGGVDRAAIEAAVDDPAAFSERLTRSYGRWIEYNAAVTAVNDVLVTITVLLVVDAFVYLLAGIVVGVSPVGRWASLGAFVALTLLLAWVTLLAYRMDHVGDVDRGGPTFEGVRISKGASRTVSHEALRRMLRAPDEGGGISDDDRPEE